MSEATYISWAVDRLNVPFPAVKKARAGDNSTVFEIASGRQRWFLKIGRGRSAECDRLQWLRGRLPAPEVVAFEPGGEQETLLTSAVPGANRGKAGERLSPGKIVEMLASALRSFHSANPRGCPCKAYAPGETLVHGDACLPFRTPPTRTSSAFEQCT